MLYTRPVLEAIGKGAEIHYLAPITGHGWKKIMRPKKQFSYEINFVPEPSELFKFLQEKARLPDKEAYYTWNMGVGYVAIAPQSAGEILKKACAKKGTEVFELGEVKEGEKRVEIKPKGIVFEND
jgi:phosphoribosylformylglycinamidine cyclo-ligase